MSVRPVVKIVKGLPASDGDGVRLTRMLGIPDAQMFDPFLMLAGRPIDEPVFWHGPFVMNSREEIVQAFEDFQRGRF